MATPQGFRKVQVQKDVPANTFTWVDGSGRFGYHVVTAEAAGTLMVNAFEHQGTAPVGIPLEAGRNEIPLCIYNYEADTKVTIVSYGL